MDTNNQDETELLAAFAAALKQQAEACRAASESIAKAASRFRVFGLEAAIESNRREWLEMEQTRGDD